MGLKLKKYLFTAILSCAVIGCMACGADKTEADTQSSPDVTEVQQAETPDADDIAKASETEGEGAEWSAEGNFVDDNDDHILLYYTSVAEGYPKDGWTITALFGDKFYGGELEEKDGSLTGTIAYYDENGNPSDEMDISLREDADTVILTKEDGSELIFVVDDTDYAAAAEDMLPMFSYNDLYAFEGYDNLEAAAYDYLSHTYMQPEDPNNVIIPYVDIVGEDYSDPKDVLVYGSYYLFEFKREGDVIVGVSGGHYPGVIHMGMLGDHDNALYSAFSLDTALAEDELKPLFGDYYDAYEKEASDSEKVDAGIAQVIADYAHAYDIPVTKYRISEGETIDLPPSHAGDMPADIKNDTDTQDG